MHSHFTLEFVSEQGRTLTHNVPIRAQVEHIFELRNLHSLRFTESDICLPLFELKLPADGHRSLKGETGHCTIEDYRWSSIESFGPFSVTQMVITYIRSATGIVVVVYFQQQYKTKNIIIQYNTKQFAKYNRNT